MQQIAVGRLRLAFSLAARNLFRQRRRALLALAIISGGVITFLLAGGFIHWLLGNMREATIHSQLGHARSSARAISARGSAIPTAICCRPAPRP